MKQKFRVRVEKMMKVVFGSYKREGKGRGIFLMVDFLEKWLGGHNGKKI